MPVTQTTRRVPLVLMKLLKQELHLMDGMEIITRMTEPSGWMSPLLLVKNKSRVCTGPRRAHKRLRRKHFDMLRREHMEAVLVNATVFSKLDAGAGFYQTPLTNETSRNCTFGNPFLRYRFLRVPFGLASAPEVFQRAMSEDVSMDCRGSRCT